MLAQSDGRPHIQNDEMPRPGYPTPLVQQGLAHPGQLNVPVGRVKRLQPVGGYIFLTFPEQESAIPYPAAFV